LTLNERARDIIEALGSSPLGTHNNKHPQPKIIKGEEQRWDRRRFAVKLKP